MRPPIRSSVATSRIARNSWIASSCLVCTVPISRARSTRIGRGTDIPSVRFSERTTTLSYPIRARRPSPARSRIRASSSVNSRSMSPRSNSCVAARSRKATGASSRPSNNSPRAVAVSPPARRSPASSIPAVARRSPVSCWYASRKASAVPVKSPASNNASGKRRQLESRADGCSMMLRRSSTDDTLPSRASPKASSSAVQL